MVVAVAKRVELRRGRLVVAESPVILMFALVTVSLTALSMTLALFAGEVGDALLAASLASPLWFGVAVSFAGASCYIRDGAVRSCLPRSGWIRSAASLNVASKGHSLFLMGRTEDGSEHRLVSVSGLFDAARAALELQRVQALLLLDLAQSGESN